MRLLPIDQTLLTIAYADIFDFPLKYEEMVYWKIHTPGRLHLNGSRGFTQTKLKGDVYMSLAGRSQLVKLRNAKARYMGKKWEIANRIGKLFRFIPSVTLVGVTGGLACNNTQKNDDIDLFFITKPGTLWISRLFVIMVCDIWGRRRKFGMKEARDSVCLNMFMAQDALRLPKKDQDLFAAHEVLQMHPLWERNGAYAQFIWANRWVAHFLPNAWRDKSKDKKQKKTKDGWARAFLFWLFQVAEPVARYVQLWYMRSHRTSEIIERGVLRFHPQDARVWVKEKYAQRLKKYNIPLDKIFYHS